VGLATFDGDVVEHVPPSVKQFQRVLHTLETARPERAGEITGPLRSIAKRLTRRGIVALLSDLYLEPGELIEALGELAGRGHDVVVFHLLSPAERQLPEAPYPQFEDMETGRRLPVNPDRVRERYAETLAAHVSALEQGLGEQGIDYAFLDTGEPLDHALFRYLTDRHRRQTVRR
jgi:uncharacterized protein (DUF58 family)